MIRRAIITGALLALTACGGTNDDGVPAGYSDTRRNVSTLEPGVHVSGHVNVGVVRNF